MCAALGVCVASAMPVAFLKRAAREGLVSFSVSHPATLQTEDRLDANHLLAASQVAPSRHSSAAALMVRCAGEVAWRLELN